MAVTPKQLGFVMPAEWEKHSATWLAWPYDKTTFPKGIEGVEKTFCKIIKSLEGGERVELVVLDNQMQNRAENLLKNFGADLANVAFHRAVFVDVWVRDYGPIFLINREQKDLAWVKWEYNAYGKAEDLYFTDLLKDNKVFNILNPDGEKFIAKMILEGGSVEINGTGVLLTTEQCLLNPNRNKELDKQQIENYLQDYLGASKIIWLKKGLVNDHTDGHIDDVAKFVSPNKILCAYEDNIEDENFEILNNNYQVLKNSTDQNGKPFELIKLPMPHMKYDDGEKAPVSYCNFYIGNKVVLVPTFADKNDESAIEIIQSCFPDRKVVAIDCREIIYGGGAIHCMTQQQPKI